MREWAFPSSSSPKIYTTQINGSTGLLSCDCPGWTVKKLGKVRECKHTKKVAQDENLTLENRDDQWFVIAAGASTSQAPIPIASKIRAQIVAENKEAIEILKSYDTKRPDVAERNRQNSAENHWNWQGGTKETEGYTYIYNPSYHRANKGYAKRADMVLEEKLGRLLEPDEEAHHINHIRSDDSPDNLEAKRRADHRREQVEESTAAGVFTGSHKDQPRDSEGKFEAKGFIAPMLASKMPDDKTADSYSTEDVRPPCRRKRMKVWILLHCLDFEGCSIIGVYDTEAKANLQRDAEIADYKKRVGQNMVGKSSGQSLDVEEWEVE